MAGTPNEFNAKLLKADYAVGWLFVGDNVVVVPVVEAVPLVVEVVPALEAKLVCGCTCGCEVALVEVVPDEVALLDAAIPI